MTSCSTARVLVVIVNYKSAGLVADVLRHLAGERACLPHLQVAVVDNASPDDSVARLEKTTEREGWGEWVRLVAHPANAGFAAGNNVAVRLALAEETPPDYIHLLNPDTIPEPGVVVELVSFLDRHPEVGIVGSQLLDVDHRPLASIFRFHTLLGEVSRGFRLGLLDRALQRWVVAPQGLPAVEQECDWVCGASLMVRREVLQEVGLMDEGYFLYYEEVDFCLRAHRAGWSCWFVPSSRVVHLEGHSTGATGAARLTRQAPLYLFDSRRRYFEKNFGRLYAAAADLALAAGLITFRIRERLQGKERADAPRLLRDFLAYSFLPQRWQAPRRSRPSATDR